MNLHEFTRISFSKIVCPPQRGEIFIENKMNVQKELHRSEILNYSKHNQHYELK